MRCLLRLILTIETDLDSCSTFLGRVSDFKGSNKFGTSEVNLPDGLLYLLKDHITSARSRLMRPARD